MGGLSRENRLWIAWVAGLAGALCVIAAQFVDYTGIQLASSGVESANEVAPPPFIEGTKAGVGPDQLWLGIPIGVAALIALRVVWRSGQWRLGRSVAAIGILALLLTVAILLPNATDGEAGGELGGAIGTAYVEADEKLLGGFWLQLTGAAALIGSGLTMTRLRSPG